MAKNITNVPWPPFRRQGTTITQRTAGDKISSTGDIEIIDAKKLLLGTGNDGQIYSSSDDLYIENVTSDKDIFFRGNDGGVATDILKLDVSAGQLSGIIKSVAGVATNAIADTDYLVNIVADTTPQLGGVLDCQENDIDNIGNLIHNEVGVTDFTIQNIDLDKDILFSGNDGGAQTTIMSLDVSAGQLSGIIKATAGVLGAASAGTDYYNPGGTDVAVTDGGTGKSSWTQYLIPFADTTTSFSQIAIGSSGQVLTSNGAGSAPTFQAAAINEWTDDGLTTAYASATTFTITGSDQTSVFTPGRLLKITQASVNSGNPFYAVVVAAAFSSDTTVTIGANYDMANEALTVQLGRHNASMIEYSDILTFVLSTTVAKGYCTAKENGRILTAMTHAQTAPTGSASTQDVHINGTTAYTSKFSIADAGNDSAYNRVDSGSMNFVLGDEFSFFIDTVGSTIPGGSLSVRIFYIPTLLINRS